MESKTLIIVFVRNTQLGAVKTRLASTVGDQMALKIYKALLKHTAREVNKVSAHKKVLYSAYIKDVDIWGEMNFLKGLQSEGDLGQRMECAFKTAFAKGYKNVVIVGSDLYSLKSSHIETAIKQLKKNEVVLGPATDGGYYLLGLKMSLSALFCNKQWGSATLLEDTLNDLKSSSVFLLEPLNDIDTFEDLKNENELLKKLKIDVKTYQ